MGIITPTNKDVTQLEGLHLYHFSMSNCSMRVRMALEEKGLPWTSHHVNLHKAENATPEYFGIHPKGLVPVLVHDGVVFIESTDIIDYLDTTFSDPTLRPVDEAEEAEMQNWMRLASENHIHVKTYMFANQIGKRMAKTEADLETYRELQNNDELREFHKENSSPEGLSAERLADSAETLNNFFARVERQLSRHEWLVGASFSLADITWIPLYVTLNNARFSFEQYPNVLRWKDAVRARGSFQKGVLDWVQKDLSRD